MTRNDTDHTWTVGTPFCTNRSDSSLQQLFDLALIEEPDQLAITLYLLSPGAQISMKCLTCFKKASHSCASCKCVHYCSIECQHLDWQLHEKECSLIAGKRDRDDEDDDPSPPEQKQRQCRNETDPISLDDISEIEERDLIVIDDHCYNIRTLYNWVVNTDHNRNPFTNLPFSKENLEYIVAEAETRYPLQVLVTNPNRCWKNYYISFSTSALISPMRLMLLALYRIDDTESLHKKVTSPYSFFRYLTEYVNLWYILLHDSNDLVPLANFLSDNIDMLPVEEVTNKTIVILPTPQFNFKEIPPYPIAPGFHGISEQQFQVIMKFIEEKIDTTAILRKSTEHLVSILKFQEILASRMEYGFDPVPFRRFLYYAPDYRISYLPSLYHDEFNMGINTVAHQYRNEIAEKANNAFPLAMEFRNTFYPQMSIHLFKLTSLVNRESLILHYGSPKIAGRTISSLEGMANYLVRNHMSLNVDIWMDDIEDTMDFEYWINRPEDDRRLLYLEFFPDVSAHRMDITLTLESMTSTYGDNTTADKINEILVKSMDRYIKIGEARNWDVSLFKQFGEDASLRIVTEHQ